MPTGATTTLEEDYLLIDRGEVASIVVKARDAEALQKALDECNKQAGTKEEPARFWKTPTGRTLKWTLGVLALGAAFEAGRQTN